jgi:N-acetylneuraminate synthase
MDDIAGSDQRLADRPSEGGRPTFLDRGEPGPLIVGEVGQAHDGSLGLAHRFIDAIAAAGAGAVKFQTHIAAAESTPAEPWRVRFSPQDETRYDYWRRMEFTEAQWEGLRAHAHDAGLLFISSPFSLQAVDLLDRIGVDAWKIASGEVTNLELLDAVCGRRPVLLSSGMSTLTELDAAVARVVDSGTEVAVLQCTSSYPTSPERVGIDLLETFRTRWGRPVGLSDHSGTIFPGLAAASLGADLVEVHVTLSRQMFGPDVVASVTADELAVLCEGARFIGEMLSHPTDKDGAASELGEMRRLFTRSLVASADLGCGHVLEPGDLVAKKPGSGVPPDRLDQLVGRRLVRSVAADQLISFDDVELPLGEVG